MCCHHALALMTFAWHPPLIYRVSRMASWDGTPSPTLSDTFEYPQCGEVTDTHIQVSPLLVNPSVIGLQ